MIHDYVRTCDWFNCARVTALHVRGSWVEDVKSHDGRCFKRVLGSISKPQALMSMNGGIDQRNLGRGKDDVRCRPADIRVTKLEQTAKRL